MMRDGKSSTDPEVVERRRRAQAGLRTTGGYQVPDSKIRCKADIRLLTRAAPIRAPTVREGWR